MITVGGLILLANACGPRTSGETASPGELTFRAYCQTCHRLPKPTAKTDSEWPPLVARYGQRAKLNDRQIADITRYLVSAN
jgi:mono/diheme cytochrome c family protein